MCEEVIWGDEGREGRSSRAAWRWAKAVLGVAAQARIFSERDSGGTPGS